MSNRRKNTFTVVGAWGHLVVDAFTGNVLDRFGDYEEIVEFDVEEWRIAYPEKKLSGSVIDILDIGCWGQTEAGLKFYWPPEDEHRKMVSEGWTGLIL